MPTARRAKLLLALVAFAAGSAEARTLVIQSSGPSAARFPPGRVLAESVKIRLQAGDRLRLLDAQGTRELKGPGLVDVRAQSRNTAVRRLPSWNEVVGTSRRPATASVRGGSGGGAKPPVRRRTAQDVLWSVDPAVGGDWCGLEQGSLGVWRAGATAAADELAVSADARPGTTVRWAAGQRTAAWLGPIGAGDAGAYKLRRGKAAETTINLHVLPASDDLRALVGELARYRCYQQLGVLLDE